MVILWNNRHSLTLLGSMLTTFIKRAFVRFASRTRMTTVPCLSSTFTRFVPSCSSFNHLCLTFMHFPNVCCCHSVSCESASFLSSSRSTLSWHPFFPSFMPHRTDTPFARATFIIYHIETLDNDLLSDVSLIYLHVCTGPYSRKLSSGNSGFARQAHCRHRPGQPRQGLGCPPVVRQRQRQVQAELSYWRGGPCCWAPGQGGEGGVLPPTSRHRHWRPARRGSAGDPCHRQERPPAKVPEAAGPWQPTCIRGCGQGVGGKWGRCSCPGHGRDRPSWHEDRQGARWGSRQQQNRPAPLLSPLWRGDVPGEGNFFELAEVEVELNVRSLDRVIPLAKGLPLMLLRATSLSADRWLSSRWGGPRSLMMLQSVQLLNIFIDFSSFIFKSLFIEFPILSTANREYTCFTMQKITFGTMRVYHIC